METDIRQTEVFQQVDAFYRKLHKPGSGMISDAAEVHASADGQCAVFSGVLFDALEGIPPSRICLTELATGTTRVLTFGPNTDRLPKISPDGRLIAFLSDRHKAGDFQLYLMDSVTGVAKQTPRVSGWVEDIQWSPNGRRILLRVAGYGAELACVHGASPSMPIGRNWLSWMPSVQQTKNDPWRWRHAWVYDLASDRTRSVPAPEHNIWEAVWCGNDRLAAVASPGPNEGLWYSAGLQLIDSETGSSALAHSPDRQIGWPAGSPLGTYVAFVEGLCSDRWLVGGDLWLLDVRSGRIHKLDSRGIDITYIEWRSDRHLLVGGQCGHESVVALCDVVCESFREIWRSAEISTTGLSVSLSGMNELGDCVLIGESFNRPPEIALIRDGKYRTVRSFDLNANVESPIQTVASVTWMAADGLEIQGWLLEPQGEGPHPLIMNVHGGPVWQWRPFWLGRRSVHLLVLLQQGFAVFLPNPRGSSGRGQSFVRRVLGDTGGADAYDCLAGLDYLVEQGIADSRRLAVTGLSYGGFMTSWLVTQDSRFAAAVSISPITNQITWQLLSNIPQCVQLFLEDSYLNPSGKYFRLSPIMHADKVRTPTLNICGALDRCTPPEEAIQFHNALVHNGIESALVVYPEEGHGVRKFPAVLDCGARIIAWIQKYMPPSVA